MLLFGNVLIVGHSSGHPVGGRPWVNALWVNIMYRLPVRVNKSTQEVLNKERRGLRTKSYGGPLFGICRRVQRKNQGRKNKKGNRFCHFQF